MRFSKKFMDILDPLKTSQLKIVLPIFPNFKTEQLKSESSFLKLKLRLACIHSYLYSKMNVSLWLH